MPYDVNSPNVVAGNGSLPTQYDLDENGNIVIPDGPVDDNSPVPAAAFQKPLDVAEIMGYSTGANVVTPPAKPFNGSVEAGSSVSATGFNNNTFGQLETNRLKGIDKETAIEQNKARAMWAPIAENEMAATENQKMANNQIADITAEKAKANSQYQLDVAGLQKQQAIDDAADYAAAQAKVQEKMNDYNQSLKEFSMMQLQPGRAYSNLTSFQRGGVMATAFVQDFLGAKGIKTSGMDFINRGIDMDIEAQKQAMANKETELSGKQNLYAMQRQLSQSDYEATVRTRGMMLEAMRAEVNGKLAAFDSPMAHAQAAAINAQFDQALVKNQAEIAKEIQNQVHNAMQIRTEQRGQNTQASIARMEMASRERIAKIEADARAGAKAGAMPKIVRTTSGEVLGKTDDEVVQRKFQEQVIGHEHMIDAANKLTKALKAAGATYSGPMGELILGKDEAKYSALYNQILREYVRSQTGAVANAEEIASMKKVLPWASLSRSLFTSTSPEESAGLVYAQFGGQNLEQLKDEARARLMPATPEEIEAYRGGYNPNALSKSEGTQAETNALTAPKAPLTKVQQLVGGADSFGGKETDTQLTLSGADNPAFVAAVNAGLLNKDMGKAGSVTYNDIGQVGIVDKPASTPRWVESLYSVYEIAIDPGQSEADRKEATDTLQNMSNDPRFNFPGFKEDKKANKAVSEFSTYLLNQIPLTGGAKVRSSELDDASPNSTPYYANEIVGK